MKKIFLKKWIRICSILTILLTCPSLEADALTIPLPITVEIYNRLIHSLPSAATKPQRDVLSLVKPSVVLGVMNRNQGNFSKGQVVEIIMDSGNGTSYKVKANDVTGWISGNSINISIDPATNRDKLSQNEMEYYVNIMGFTSDTSYFIWVDIDRQLLNVFQGSFGKWHLLRSVPCATGTNDTPTLRGLNTLQDRGTSFGGYNELGAKYYVRFNGNYMIHSLPYQYGKIADYTLGQRASHGCVRLSLEDAYWIYYYMPTGTSVWTN